jgi:hypothetical protein
MLAEFKCSKCSEELCADPRFRVYHTKLQFENCAGKEEIETKYCNYVVSLKIIFELME